MHSLLAISLTAAAAAAVVSAQNSSSSSATPTSTASSLIPTNISSGCSSFLESLNSNSTLASCIVPVVNATSAFSPLSNSSVNASSSAVNSALGTLCSTSTLSSGCSDADIRGQLSSFYSSCGDELTGASPDQDVIRIYDVLYTIIPLKDSVCSKDDSGNYCVTQISASSNSTDQSSASASVSVDSSKSSVTSTSQDIYELVQNNLWSYASDSSLKKRGSEDDVAALIPNITTFRSTNLAFFFLSEDTPSDQLCTSCTRSVLTSYMTFEQSVPYALGIANSPLLGGQSDLYNAITSECGSSFLSGAVQAAGGISDGIISGAAPRMSTEGGVFTATAAAVLGLVALL
ncbi:hypothetical protein ACEPAF_9278 [Sanghuangporus sanghuang]